MKRSSSDESIESENNQDDNEEKEEEEEEETLLNGKRRPMRKNEKELKKGQTQEDSPEIQRILGQKENDYYAILNLNSQATREDISNAYRKLSVRVHPDKFNTPGATQATQRLNKARSELFKKFESAKSNGNEPTTRISQAESTVIDEDAQEDSIEEYDSISTLIPMADSNEEKIQGNSSNPIAGYILLVVVLVVIIVVIIFIIYWIKRKRSVTNETKSSKGKKSRAYDSPNSNEGGRKNRDSQVSILQD